MTNSKRAPIRPGKPASLSRLSEGTEIRAMEDVCRGDFMSFVARCFDHLMPGTSLLPNWHIEALAFRLEQVHRGETKKLIINLPPRYLKSLLTSVALPAFV